MTKKRIEEPIWCTLYRQQVLNKQRTTEQRGRTQASREGFYTSKEWIIIRNKRRKLSPLCQICEVNGRLTPGKIVDHIVPVEDAPAFALDIENTQHLCYSCNDWKTKEDQRRKKKEEKIKRGRELMKQFETI